MKRIISGFVACFMLSSFSMESSAFISTYGLFAPLGSGVSYMCKITATGSSGDHTTAPGGLANRCEIANDALGGVFTLYDQGNVCPWPGSGGITCGGQGSYSWYPDLWVLATHLYTVGSGGGLTQQLHYFNSIVCPQSPGACAD